jgi:hypothetical protein
MTYTEARTLAATIVAETGRRAWLRRHAPDDLWVESRAADGSTHVWCTPRAWLAREPAAAAAPDPASTPWPLGLEHDAAGWWILQGGVRKSGPYRSQGGAELMRAALEEARATAEAKIRLGYPVVDREERR